MGDKTAETAPCPKCSRPNGAHRARCLYCGEPLAGGTATSVPPGGDPLAGRRPRSWPPRPTRRPSTDDPEPETLLGAVLGTRVGAGVLAAPWVAALPLAWALIWAHGVYGPVEHQLSFAILAGAIGVVALGLGAAIGYVVARRADRPSPAFVAGGTVAWLFPSTFQLAAIGLELLNAATAGPATSATCRWTTAERSTYAGGPAQVHVEAFCRAEGAELFVDLDLVDATEVDGAVLTVPLARGGLGWWILERSRL